MVKDTELIVLHTTRFGEKSIVVHTLSKEYGRRGFLVKNAGNKSVSRLFQPLSILEAGIVETPKSSLYPAKDFSLRYPLTGIRNDFSKNAMTMFMSEVLYRVIKDGTYETGLYEWCVRSILLLDAIDSDFNNFHIRFLLEFCVTLGFSPTTQDLMPFVGEHHTLVRQFMTAPFAEAMLIPLTGRLRNEIAEDILRYIEFHTESAVNINSLKVLRELFA
ncbi:MAG: recombination protein O N-terminal domain-containing protein [Bacteroidales bacterium]|nr:recombination protein O N-terminal domain-containing protein [Bacteroidales bacterium]